MFLAKWKPSCSLQELCKNVLGLTFQLLHLLVHNMCVLLFTEAALNVCTV